MNTARATLEAYQRWAPLYPPSAHNPLMRAEQRAMLELWPSVAGKQVLDLACGSGRYCQLLQAADAAHVVAVDFCLRMLLQAKAGSRVCASMMRLPFGPGAFDAVVSGLAVGHAPDIRRWMDEVTRVLRPAGSLLYSDFHSEAIRAGMTRSFKDETGATWTVPHQVHDLSCQREAMAAAGLRVQTVKELRMGMELDEPFPGSKEVYRRWYGVPVVLIVQAAKAES